MKAAFKVILLVLAVGAVGYVLGCLLYGILWLQVWFWSWAAGAPVAFFDTWSGVIFIFATSHGAWAGMIGGLRLYLRDSE